MDMKMTKIPSNISKSVYLNTDCDIDSFVCNWKIHNYSVTSFNSCLESSVFSKSEEDNIKWKINLYPKGKDNKEVEQNKSKNEEFENEESENEESENEESENKESKGNESKDNKPKEEHASIYLELVDCKKTKVNTFCTFSILKHNGSEFSQSFSHCYETKGSSEGIEHFMNYDDLVKNGYLKNDILHIMCEIKWSVKRIKSYTQDVPYLDFNLETNDFEKDLSKDISSLYYDERLSDVCLVVEDVTLRVHKIILAARSSVFAAMFKNDMKESKENIVKIKEIKLEIVKAMLSYIYTGHVQDIERKALELLKAADMYDLGELKLLCENSLCKSLTVDNVLNILQVADTYNAKNLKKGAINFINGKICVRV